MNQNPIDDVLDELHFTPVQKEGFLKFINYAKTCQDTGNNKQLKTHLEEVIKDIVAKS